MVGTFSLTHEKNIYRSKRAGSLRGGENPLRNGKRHRSRGAPERQTGRIRRQFSVVEAGSRYGEKGSLDRIRGRRGFSARGGEQARQCPPAVLREQGEVPFGYRAGRGRTPAQNGQAGEDRAAREAGQETGQEILVQRIRRGSGSRGGSRAGTGAGERSG